MGDFFQRARTTLTASVICYNDWVFNRDVENPLSGDLKGTGPVNPPARGIFEGILEEGYLRGQVHLIV